MSDGPRLDGERLLARLAALAAVGADPDGGVTRLAFSPEDVAGRDLVAGWMREAGLDVHVDAACNLVGRRAGAGGAGDGPALVLGSHLDTVVQAGAYDGCYGVLAAVEVAAALHAAGVALAHPLAVIAFADEEGANGTPAFVGSLAVVGTPPPLDRPCDDGRTLRQLVAGAGGAPDRLADAAWPAGSVAHYVELHIEQGPVLHHAGVAIGAVTGITGQHGVAVSVEGAANHAGTTPMDLRRDAAVAAAHVVLAVRDLAVDGLVRVATAGQVSVAPGVSNVVAGRARVGVDVRDLDDARIAAAHARLAERCDAIARATGTVIALEPGHARPAAPCDPAGIAAVERAALDRGLTTMRLPSGAGHDAQVMAAAAPVTMIFVPSRDGVSHSPHEHTEPRHLVAGAEVLLDVVLRLDERRP